MIDKSLLHVMPGDIDLSFFFAREVSICLHCTWRCTQIIHLLKKDTARCCAVPISSTEASIETERIPAKRTSAGIARLEPLSQTARVEHVLASRTFLVRDLLVRADNRVTNGTFCLAFHCSCCVSSPCREAVDEAAILCYMLACLLSSFRRTLVLTENAITP